MNASKITDDAVRFLPFLVSNLALFVFAALCRAALCSAAFQGGKIIISHPKGASNVDMQRRANPMLVPNRLPTEAVSERDVCLGSSCPRRAYVSNDVAYFFCSFYSLVSHIGLVVFTRQFLSHKSVTT